MFIYLTNPLHVCRYQCVSMWAKFKLCVSIFGGKITSNCTKTKGIKKVIWDSYRIHSPISGFFTYFRVECTVRMQSAGRIWIEGVALWLCGSVALWLCGRRSWHLVGCSKALRCQKRKKLPPWLLCIGATHCFKPSHETFTFVTYMTMCGGCLPNWLFHVCSCGSS